MTQPFVKECCDVIKKRKFLGEAWGKKKFLFMICLFLLNYGIISAFPASSNCNMQAGNFNKELNTLNLIEILIRDVLLSRMGGRYTGNNSKNVCTDPSG